MLLAALSEREDLDTAHEVAKLLFRVRKDQVKVRPKNYSLKKQ